MAPRVQSFSATVLALVFCASAVYAQNCTVVPGCTECSNVTLSSRLSYRGASNLVNCTACSAPEYELNQIGPIGMCKCAPGYGRNGTRGTQASCQRCPAGYVSGPMAPKHNGTRPCQGGGHGGRPRHLLGRPGGDRAQHRNPNGTNNSTNNGTRPSADGDHDGTLPSFNGTHPGPDGDHDGILPPFNGTRLGPVDDHSDTLPSFNDTHPGPNGDHDGGFEHGGPRRLLGRPDGGNGGFPGRGNGPSGTFPNPPAFNGTLHPDHNGSWTNEPCSNTTATVTPTYMGCVLCPDGTAPNADQTECV